MPESNISRYRHCESVGAGCAGEVYRSVCPDDGSPKAVKRLGSMAIDRDFLESNYRRYARAPRHPGVVHVSDYQFDRSPYYIAMDWIEADSTLENLPVPMPESEAWPAIYELADSIAHLHTYGIGHGNLHPGNVFYSRDETPRTQVTDFGPGLVGKVHHLNIGETAWFAPPEQLDNPEQYGEGALERWDVYRFGALAFWLINGEIPRGHSHARLRRKMADRQRRKADSIRFSRPGRRFSRESGVQWKVPSENRADQLRREVIDHCLAIDPADRPVDMREVHGAFEKLETKFALEEAEVRVAVARRLQAGKLLFSRGLAACLGAGLLAASVYLVSSLNRNRSLHNQVGELSAVVDLQKETIDDVEDRWSQWLRELKEFRSAAGSVISQMSQSGMTEGIPAETNPVPRENLEKSRAFFEKSLKDLGESPPEQVERSVCLHNLAHLEQQLGNSRRAYERYQEAAALYETMTRDRASEEALISDIEPQMADCYLQLATLIEIDPGDEMLEALQRASDFLGRVRKRHPEDRKIAMRAATTDLWLGRQLHAHRKFDQAIEVLASAGESLAKMPESVPEKAAFSELLSRIQYHAALCLRETGRHTEAFDSHLAGMETIARVADGHPFTAEQRRRLGQSYAELGELFSEHANQDETRAHFNEAVRLLTPLCDSGHDDPEATIFLSRSVARLAQIERKSARWTDSYRLSLAAIEKLEEVLENHPDHIDCQLTLSGFRAPHTEILKYNRSAALRCLENGLEMVACVQKRIDEDETMIEPVRRTWQIRIARIYDEYETTCRSLGETGKAQMCAERANRARELLVEAGG